jgi:hypothetical protein
MNEFAIATLILLAVAVMEAVLNVKLYRRLQEWREVDHSERVEVLRQQSQLKNALRELYKHAQRACEIRSDMLSKITDLERCAQAHEAWITEQEEKQRRE